MIEENWKELAYESAKNYCDANGIKITTLGARIVGDADFFPDLKDPNKGCTCKTLLKVKRWFAANNQTKKSKKTTTKN